MRFLVENGAYNLDNLGDNAMLRVTVRRLLDRWPGARIDVVTEKPDRVRQHLPGATPLLAGPWFRLPIVPLPRRFEPSLWAKRIRWWERHLDGLAPRWATSRRLRFARDHEVSALQPSSEFYSALEAADGVLCCGGGLINDWFFEHARQLLTTLRAAQGLGKPTAMLGLGLGPADLDHVRRRAAPVLKRLDVLALRESEVGPRLARELGVPQRIIRVTGDDAIELALDQPVTDAESRHGLGVNLRLAPHAQVPEGVVPTIGRVLKKAAARLHASLTPVPIRSTRSPANDVDAVNALLGGAVDLSEARAMCEPDEVIAAVARCRLVVTGAYHSAVFALSCGIPVVGMAQSDYYHAKLGGLATQFGVEGAMAVLRYDDPDLPSRLESAIHDFWDRSGTVAKPLREAAQQQVRLSREAYTAFFDRVDAATARRPRCQPAALGAKPLADHA